MYEKNGWNSTLRMPGRSILSLLLFTLVTALLASSLGVTLSVERTLSALSAQYTTIAVAVQTQEGVTSAALAADEAAISSLSFPDGVRTWEREGFAQGYLPQAAKTLSASTPSSLAVLRVRIRPKGVFSGRGTFPAFVEQALYSAKEVENCLIEVDWDTLEEEQTYLVYGTWYPGQLGTLGTLRLLQAPLALPDAAEAEYLALAEQLHTRCRSVRVCAPASLSHYFPFQQNLLQLAEGRLFTPQEAAAGSRVCLLPKSLADWLDIHVGDRIPLCIAVGENCPVLEAYDPARGFDLEDTFLVVGLLDAKDDWNNTIFLPPQPGLDFGRGHSTQTLGQFVLKNGTAEDFILWAETQLPDGVRLRVYDQGYAAAARPIRAMLRAMRRITAVCLLAGACFLLLNVWLFVSRQRRTAVLMHRLGASRLGLCRYFVGALLPLLLCAAVLGIWSSRFAVERVAGLLAPLMQTASEPDLRYSDTHLSMQKTVPLVRQAAPDSLYWLVALAVVGLGLLLCCYLALHVASDRRRHSGLRQLRTRTRTRTLQGGAAKYALLCATRGGFRTLVSVLAPMAAALLFCFLAVQTDQSATALRTLEADTLIRGYFASVDGGSADRVLVNGNDVFGVSSLAQTQHATLTERETTYCCDFFYIGKLNGFAYAEEINVPEVPHNKYQVSRLTAYYLQACPQLIYASSMQDVPQMMFQAGDAITWLDGYDDRIMQGFLYGAPACDTAVSLEYQENWSHERMLTRTKIKSATNRDRLYQYMPCVVSTAFLQTHGLRLGDEFTACRILKDNLYLSRYRVVGSYVRTAGRETVYQPYFMPSAIGPELDEQWKLQSGEALGIGNPVWAEQLRQGIHLYSAVYRFRAAELAAVRDALTALQLTEVGDRGGGRKPFVLEDQAFLAAKHSIEQRLWYMNASFPVVVALTELLAPALSILQMLSRRRELWLMHCIGTGRPRAFGGAVLEQLGLCLMGTLLGLGAARLLGILGRTSAVQAGIFAALWLLGSLCSAGILVARPHKNTGEG